MVDSGAEMVFPTKLTEEEEQKTFEAAWALEEWEEEEEPEYCPKCSGTGFREELASRCPDCFDGYLNL